MSRNADLKENILASQLERFLVWGIERKVQVLTSVGVAVAAVLIGSVFALRQSQTHEQSRTQIAYSQALLSQGKYAEAAKALDQARKLPMDQDTARLSSYLRGVAAFGLGNADEAIPLFNETLSRSTGHPIRPLALSDLGAAYEQKKDFNAAVRTYTTFMTDYPDSFLAPRIMLALGRTQFLFGNQEDGKKTLDRLLDLYPTSEWAENARRLIDKNKIR